LFLLKCSGKGGRRRRARERERVGCAKTRKKSRLFFLFWYL